MIPKAELDEALIEVLGWSRKIARLFRGLIYFILATLLLSASTYEIPAFWTIASAIGLSGLLAGTAFIGQTCLIILAVLAVVPASTISMLSHAFP